MARSSFRGIRNKNMIQLTTLPNGLKVITDEMPSIHSINIGVWVNVGARHEKIHEHGLAHMLEHMAFKGTKTRSARDIAEQTENVGAMMNAYTGREQTAYFMRALKQDAELCADILGDILQNSVFDEEEIIREKGVIIQEIGEYEDNPDDVLFDNLQDISYPEQILGRTILGTKESVMGLSRQNLFDYIGNHYVPQNMIFAASGNIKHEDMLELANKYMNFPEKTINSPHESLKWGGGNLELQKDLEQLHMVFSLPSLNYFDPDYYTSEVFSILYGGGMSSRLFQEIREKRGLVYTISSFTTHYEDGGNFAIYAGTDPEKAHEVIDCSITEMENLANSVSISELERAKAQIRAGLLMGLESPSGRTEALVRQKFLFDRFISPEEMIEKVSAVKADDIYRFANRLLEVGTPASCMIGRVDKVNKDYQERLARFLR